MTDKLIKI